MAKPLVNERTADATLDQEKPQSVFLVTAVALLAALFLTHTTARTDGAAFSISGGREDTRTRDKRPGFLSARERK